MKPARRSCTGSASEPFFLAFLARDMSKRAIESYRKLSSSCHAAVQPHGSTCTQLLRWELRKSQFKAKKVESKAGASADLEETKTQKAQKKKRKAIAYSNDIDAFYALSLLYDLYLMQMIKDHAVYMCTSICAVHQSYKNHVSVLLR